MLMLVLQLEFSLGSKFVCTTWWLECWNYLTRISDCACEVSFDFIFLSSLYTFTDLLLLSLDTPILNLQDSIINIILGDYLFENYLLLSRCQVISFTYSWHHCCFLRCPFLLKIICAFPLPTYPKHVIVSYWSSHSFRILSLNPFRLLLMKQN